MTSDDADAVALTALIEDPCSDDELFARLADSAGLGADDIGRSQEGRTIFSRVWRRFKKTVCGDPIVKAYVSNPSVSDVTVVAVHLANLYKPIEGVNAFLLTALTMRIGLRSLCADEPNEP